MVPISPEIYSSTAVVMDNRGLADYIARTQQRLAAQKAAKDEALDKYFNDLQNKINTAGVRTQDLKMNPADPNSPGILTDIEQWGNNWMQNKEAIRKGGLPQQQHLNKFQEIIRKIQQSKDRAKTSDEINKLRIEGKIDEEDFPTVQKIDASIYDPRGYKEDGITEYSLGDFSAFVPTWDVPKRKQYIDFAASGIDPAGRINEKTVIDPYTGNKVTTFDKVYTQDQLKKMAEKAIAIGSDKSGLKTYKNLLKEGERDIPSEEFISLAKAYNSVFRDDAMDTPLKVAAADIILNKMGVVGTGRTAEGRPARDGGGQQGPFSTNIWDYDLLNKYDTSKGELIDVVKEGKTKEERLVTPTRVVLTKNIPSQDYDLITNKGDVIPYTEGGRSYFIVRDDGNWEGRGGKVVDAFTVARANLDKTSLSEQKRLQQGITSVRPQSQELKPKVSEPKKEKTYSIGGKEFTLSQVQAGAKKNKMTVTEYLSSFGIKE